MKHKQFIEIGGVLYSRKAKLSGLEVYIVGYDINTEQHLFVKTSFADRKRIELNNDKLLLRERYQRKYK